MFGLAGVGGGEGLHCYRINDVDMWKNVCWNIKSENISGMVEAGGCGIVCVKE